MNYERLFNMKMSAIYTLYLDKVKRKHQNHEDVDRIMMWLTGYDQGNLSHTLQSDITVKAFFENAPYLNPNRYLIKGVICGIRVEDIEDSLIQNIRYLDKLVDECAKGKNIDKILRKTSQT